MHRQLPMSTQRSSNLGVTTSTLGATALTTTTAAAAATTVPPSPSDVDDVFYPDRSMNSVQLLPPIRGRGGGGGGGGGRGGGGRGEGEVERRRGGRGGVVEDWFANEARRRRNEGVEWDLSRRNGPVVEEPRRGGGGGGGGRGRDNHGEDMRDYY